MNSFIQLESFIVSFIYGIIFCLLSIFNKYILINKNILINFIITLIFIIDIVLLYIFIMYKINNGIIHPFFIITVLLGFITCYKLKCKIYVKLKKLRDKFKHIS